MELRSKNGNIIPKLTLLQVQYLIQNCTIISFIQKVGCPDDPLKFRGKFSLNFLRFLWCGHPKALIVDAAYYEDCVIAP